jgi:hypothetical protein
MNESAHPVRQLRADTTPPGWTALVRPIRRDGQHPGRRSPRRCPACSVGGVQVHHRTRRTRTPQELLPGRPSEQYNADDCAVACSRAARARLVAGVPTRVTVSGRCVLVDRPCEEIGTCALHIPWLRARAQLLKELSKTSVAPLVVDLGSIETRGGSGAVWSLPHGGDLDGNLVRLDADDRRREPTTAPEACRCAVDDRRRGVPGFGFGFGPVYALSFQLPPSRCLACGET